MRPGFLHVASYIPKMEIIFTISHLFSAKCM
jgi:hypothetical protein